MQGGRRREKHVHVGSVHSGLFYPRFAAVRGKVHLKAVHDCMPLAPGDMLVSSMERSRQPLRAAHVPLSLDPEHDNVDRIFLLEPSDIAHHAHTPVFFDWMHWRANDDGQLCGTCAGRGTIEFSKLVGDKVVAEIAVDVLDVTGARVAIVVIRDVSACNVTDHFLVDVPDGFTVGIPDAGEHKTVEVPHVNGALRAHLALPHHALSKTPPAEFLPRIPAEYKAHGGEKGVIAWYESRVAVNHLDGSFKIPLWMLNVCGPIDHDTHDTGFPFAPEAYWVSAARWTLALLGINEAAFCEDPVSPRHAEMLAQCVGHFAWTCPYLSDLSPGHDGRMRTIDQYWRVRDGVFGDHPGPGGDCEDGARDMQLAFQEIHDYPKPREPLLRALQRLARHYCGMGVDASIRNTKGGGNPRSVDEDGPVTLHMHFVMIPWHRVAAMFRATGSDAVAALVEHEVGSSVVNASASLPTMTNESSDRSMSNWHTDRGTLSAALTRMCDGASSSGVRELVSLCNRLRFPVTHEMFEEGDARKRFYHHTIMGYNPLLWHKVGVGASLFVNTKTREYAVPTEQLLNEHEEVGELGLLPVYSEKPGSPQWASAESYRLGVLNVWPFPVGLDLTSHAAVSGLPSIENGTLLYLREMDAKDPDTDANMEKLARYGGFRIVHTEREADFGCGVLMRVYFCELLK